MKDKKYSNWRTDLRIIRAITTKDILEAVKNKHAISVVIVALFTAIIYTFIPALTALDNPTNVLVYDAANSPLSSQLKGDQSLEVYTYPSEDAMLEHLARGEVPELGLVIPADFEQSVASNADSQEDPVISGHVLYWVSDQQAAKLIQEVEAEITRLTGKPVQIQLAEQRLIPNPEQHALGMWVGAALVFLVIYISLSLISNLMLEEKLNRTLEALRVSPARNWHVVLAKAITGMFYCLVGIAVTLVINQKIILHWGLIASALVLGTLFFISLGLMAGSMIEDRGQFSIWTFGLLLPLFIPVFLSNMAELLPQWLNQVIAWIPSVTFFQLLQASFSWVPPVSTLLAQFAWLMAWCIAGLAGAIWVVRHQEHKIMGDQESLITKFSPALAMGSRGREAASTPSTGNITTSTTGGIQALSRSSFSTRPVSPLRIVLTIAAKDIRQSIHNKVILSILLGTTLLVAGNAVLLGRLSAIATSQANLEGSSIPIISIMISISLMALGVALVPILILEEKEAHTLETLLVSPARYMQVVAGKALAGSAYCLSGVVVMMIAYHFLIIHWQLALLALLLGTAFVVALGLLVGMVSNNPTTVGMWSAVIILVLIIPVILAGLGGLEQVPWLEPIMAHWPSTAVVNLFNLAMVVNTPPGAIIENTSVVICTSILLYLVTWWLVRRTDR
jgi:ABC-type Na+ efflux pump permease subunit